MGAPPFGNGVLPRPGRSTTFRGNRRRAWRPGVGQHGVQRGDEHRGRLLAGQPPGADSLRGAVQDGRRRYRPAMRVADRCGSRLPSSAAQTSRALLRSAPWKVVVAGAELAILAGLAPQTITDEQVAAWRATDRRLSDHCTIFLLAYGAMTAVTHIEADVTPRRRAPGGSGRSRSRLISGGERSAQAGSRTAAQAGSRTAARAGPGRAGVGSGRGRPVSRRAGCR